MGNSSDSYEYNYNFNEENWEDALTSYMKILKYVDISRIILFTITAIVGIIGNGLVIWITGFKMKSVSAVWFLNLAIADFISCLFLLLYIAELSIPMFKEEGSVLCFIRLLMLSLNMLTSVYFLVVISLDRCVSTMWPLWTRVHRRLKPARIISGIIWVFCLVSGFLYEAYHFDNRVEYECIVKRYLINKEFLEEPREKHITRLIIMFVLPFTVILVSYSLVVFKISGRRRWNKSNRPFKVIIGLVVCFFICCFPFHLSSVTPDIDDDNPLKNVLKEEICLCLAYFNSCLNPIIYVLLSPDVKAKTLRNRMESAITGQCDLNDDDEMPNTTHRSRRQCSTAL